VIAHLKGSLLRKQPQEVVLDVAGVGYRVLIPVSTFYRLGDEGSAVSLRIHTHVRDDAFQLFGFADAREQLLFERLIQVAGVGPKLALNILSGIEAPELVDAIRSDDLPRLTRIPGVGKKTAERILVETRDKLGALATGPEPAGAAPTGKMEHDLLSALANLGYSRPEARRGVERALREEPEGRFEDLLRRALQALSGR
jgi:Holliday junction DNA helicase RuvA